ncbi:MAG TPA: hypothetical protein VFX50_09120 [Gemmatimonadales bacterium]|nr:hypothetical protein [Gemmatimonadales bacterium]
MPAAPPVTLTLYYLADVGERIDLDAAERRLAGRAAGRVLPSRTAAKAIKIPHPPLLAPMAVPGEFAAPDGARARASALLFDFGVVSLRLHVAWDAGAAWPAVRDRAATLVHGDTAAWFAPMLESLRRDVGPALLQPDLARETQEYAIVRLVADAREVPLAESDLAMLLLDERRPLAATGREMLGLRDHAFTALDRAVVGYDAAVVVDPDPADEDVEYVLEFANAQLLELQVYDAVLDAQGPALEAGASGAPRRFPSLGRRYSRLELRTFQLASRTARLVQQADNALTITDDVYLARIYRSALDVMLEPAWRRSLDRRLELLRATYGALSGEAQAARSELLEMLIVLLIVLEIALALLGVLR